MRVAVVNAGSSSLKLRVLDADDELTADRTIEVGDDHRATSELTSFLRAADGIDAVGHRVVHGGPRYEAPVRITAEVLADLEALAAIAPLHNPPAVEAIRVVSRVLPHAPGVACFDTAFHTTLPPAAATYGIPSQWTEEWGLRRYGFHGLSHAWSSRRAAALLRTPPEDLRVVVCHLGAGASLAAVVGGRAVDTTMGFTPLEGLVMASRSGSVDPGLILWVQQHHGLGADEIEDVLNHRSGLLGVSGRSADLREVISAAGAGDPSSTLALEVYLHRLCREIGGMVASAGGADGVVFTGGVGEHSPLIRERCVERLAFLGLAIDRERNERHAGGDAVLSPETAPVAVAVVEAREDLEIARHTRRILA